MTLWLWSVVAVVVAMLIPTVMACRGRMAERWVALQMGAALTVVILVIMSFAFHAAILMDLSLALVLLGVPATLVVAVALERWI
ncbi:MAG TPA: hypothetical protein VHB27_02015 [Rhodopila sp.]|uniref:monovalent cation/H+ antiporter complex subunit F n=1 Tax=Rhodopila sp. TaxID=2480087 RepID=UPI002BF5A746|nr:hypothetical protein [Rhodopila sp.]HVY13975.1 hypothetical protein [Rhodopila sp.]